MLLYVTTSDPDLTFRKTFHVCRVHNRPEYERRKKSACRGPTTRVEIMLLQTSSAIPGIYDPSLLFGLSHLLLGIQAR